MLYCARNMTLLLSALLFASAHRPADAPTTKTFTVTAPSEVVATITAGCSGCDWSADGREALILELRVDDVYSQHLALVRGEHPSPYRVLLGLVGRGTHRLTLSVDRARSAPHAGALQVTRVDTASYLASTPEFEWLQHAPFLRARPGTVEQFSDFPLVMYAEHDVRGETGQTYRFQYTVIFTNEDGGTPTDRLMATWGRTTDIEFVYGLPADKPAGEIQAEGHKWIPFAGPRRGTHPVLWVATLNNMVADHGPDEAITFAPAPEMVDLRQDSREKVMDLEPWMYAVTSAEMKREDRIDSAAQAGSGKIPDPHRYATVEACGDVTDATLAFDIGVRGTDGTTTWYATDRGDPRFRIARGGCFRGGAPLPEGVTPAQVAALRIRAYTRPPHEGEAPLPAGSGTVTLRTVRQIFMLGPDFLPVKSPFTWTGALGVKTDAGAVDVR